MRINLIAFIVGITFLNVTAAAVRGQGISLTVSNVAIEKVFEAIEKQSNYGFLYQRNTFKDVKPVTLDIKNAALRNALDQLFANQPLTYDIVKNVIVVKPKEKSVLQRLGEYLQNITVNGTVTDENGKPLIGASVTVMGTNIVVITNQKGQFTINNVSEKAILLISYIGYSPKEIGVKKEMGNISLQLTTANLNIVTVVSTGLQQLPKERATGSFVIIDSALFNRVVGTTVLERLDGIATGVYFNGSKTVRPLGSSSFSSIGINIRGQSTLSDNVSKNPLVILDNFPYEGTLDNLNPNDIANITILKDAAAASIWGARSGNGVIVITTKKGRLNQKPVISFNSNVTIGNKPDLFKDKKFVDASTYIDIEKYLYAQGYFTADINNTTTRPALSPVVDILASSLSQTEKDTQIDALRSFDVRNDYEKYFYQKIVNQQYSLGIQGGGKQMVYVFSVGYDNNRDNVINNGYSRITLNAQNTYTPIKNLDIITALNYTSSKTSRNNQVTYGMATTGGKFGNLPYAQLADVDGNALPIVKDYRAAYVNSTATLGFLDWKYRPLDEMNNGDAYDNTSNLLARISTRYRFTSFLNAELLYQNESQKIDTWEHYSTQTYYARNLINKFSVYNAATKTFTYNLPNAGILNRGRYERNSDNGRFQLNYDQSFEDKHLITAIAGAEIREFTTFSNSFTTYGYDNEYGTANTRLNYNTSYPVNPSGNATIGTPINGLFTTTNRFLSYYANVAYTFNNRYTATLSGRKDGANIFGAKTNDKITPLWSAGLAWTASKEDFYHLDWLPYFRLRATYGFNGNVYNGSAYAIGGYSTDASLTGAQIIVNLKAPNPELRWEKVKNINLGIDFASKGKRLNGSIELWQKEGLDLIDEIPLATSTGFTSFIGNSAHTRTKGMDIELNSQNLKGLFSWNTSLLSNLQKDRIMKYNILQTSASMQSYGGVALVGKPLHSMFSYKWAGLDPSNGDPMGYLNGVVSKNYTGIISNFNPDSLVFSGSARPTVFGALRNDFSYRNFSLSINISYKLGYVFRRASTSINYAEVLNSNGYNDVTNRWQKPGDENSTSVPSLVYANNTNRARFYQYAEVLIEKGDHIRLQDVRLNFNLTKANWKNIPFRSFQIYAYASNLGILWRENKFGIDPDISGSNTFYTIPNPFTLAFGLNVSL